MNLRLSFKTIALCRRKYGKGEFYGFEDVEESILDNLSEEELSQDVDELMRNEMIAGSGDDINFSPLARYIFRMMTEPEQFIMLRNEANGKCVKIYILDAYYFGVVEDKAKNEELGDDRCTLVLLPLLDNIIQSFSYALYLEEDGAIGGGRENPDFHVIGKSWNKDRKLISDLAIRGNYLPGKVRYEMLEHVAAPTGQAEEFESDTRGLINRITAWMFEQIAAMYESEVR